MAERDYEMTGLLFRERDKKSEKAPDYTGKLTMNGIEFRLAGWLKEGANGKFLSLKVSLPEDAPRRGRREDEDDMPF